MKLGTPVILITTDAFRALGEIESKTWGWEVPIAAIQHPLGGLPADQLHSRADQVVQFFLSQADRRPDDSPLTEQAVSESSPTLLVPRDPWDFLDYLQRQGWGDGLPVFHPTQERVARMLASADIAPGTLVGRIPPRRLDVVVDDVATNAIMAGCPDAAFPVVLAAVRASLHEEFNLLGILATTHPCGTAVIVSGPVTTELGMNAAASLYGPGNRMNATIGRSVRLALQNLGGAWPGVTDKSTQGNPAKYSYCFAENLFESPWPAHHVERGFSESDSTVTVVAAEAPHNIHDPASSTGHAFLHYTAGSMRHAGHNEFYHLGDLFLVLSPEHARLLAGDGWTRESIRTELFAQTKMRSNVMSREAFDHFVHHWPVPVELDYETSEMSIVDSADQIHIAVAGGPGKHSSWLPTFGITYSSTEKVD